MIEETITKKLFDAVTIVASGDEESEVIDLTKMEGFFRSQINVSGDGTCKVEWLESINDGTDWFDSYADLANGLDKTSGPALDGKSLMDITVDLSSKGKVLITETGGVQPVTVSFWLLTR